MTSLLLICCPSRINGVPYRDVLAGPDVAVEQAFLRCHRGILWQQAEHPEV